MICVVTEPGSSTEVTLPEVCEAASRAATDWVQNSDYERGQRFGSRQVWLTYYLLLLSTVFVVSFSYWLLYWVQHIYLLFISSYAELEHGCMVVVGSESVLFGIQLLLLILMTFGKSPSLPCQLNASLRRTLTTSVMLWFSLLSNAVICSSVCLFHANMPIAQKWWIQGYGYYGTLIGNPMWEVEPTGWSKQHCFRSICSVASPSTCPSNCHQQGAYHFIMQYFVLYQRASGNAAQYSLKALQWPALCKWCLSLSSENVICVQNYILSSKGTEFGLPNSVCFDGKIPYCTDLVSCSVRALIVLLLLIVFHWRSIAKWGECFQQRPLVCLWTCLFVCLSTR